MVSRRVLALGIASLMACSSRDGDPPEAAQPNVLGPGTRLRDIQSPGAGQAGRAVRVSSAVVVAVDGFDETRDGSSRGTVWLQDVDYVGPYGGISLFNPAFQPANLRLSPGDVVDLDGQYVEQRTIGSTVDFGTSYLPQLVKPVTTFRYEVAVPKPIEIPLTDLMYFSTGRKWIGVLVTVKDVVVANAPTGDSKNSGRRTAAFTTDKGSPALSNELSELPSFAPGTTFKSITGVVTFFFNLKIAPRSADDLVP